MIDLYPEITKSIDVGHTCRTYFGIDSTIERIIADNLPTGKGSYTTVFESSSHEVYAFCWAEDPLILRDIKRIVTRMGMKAETYLPPAGHPDYFLDYGSQAFRAAFPGRNVQAGDDLTFYESLTPYNPALVKISEVTGELRQYVPVIEKWHKALDYTYKRIEVSL